MTPNVAIPIRYLITRGEATDQNIGTTGPKILKIIKRATESNVVLVQIREKNLSSRSLYQLALDAAAITKGTRTSLLINDRLDIALAAEADGVHLASQSLPVDVVRRIVPTNFLIGSSTHSLVEIKAARQGGADFAVYGPVFDTPGKGDAKGVDDLADVCRRSAGFPVIALGAIGAENFERAIHAGAAGVAAIRWLNEEFELPDSSC